ncbi:hypothetical protein BC829DRAFT_436231 [Chytridium lagenaria]|nr:hypothetical protein BC829DRAFT_436231 [Chytridium lagenaria]
MPSFLTVLLVALATSPLLINADFELSIPSASTSITVSALNNNSMSQITMSARVPVNTWIGLGFPADLNKPGSLMADNDLFIAFANANSEVSSLYSKPTVHNFVAVQSQGDFVLLPSSSYSNGVLRVQFTRPIAKVPSGATTYIGATGPIVSNAPRVHTAHASISNAVIFASGQSGSGSTVAVTTTTSATTTKSGAVVEKVGAVGAFVMGVLGVLAVL